MKKTLLALGILTALAFNTQATFALCHCHCHCHPGKQIMKKHHSYHIKKAYRHHGCPFKNPCPCGAACPLSTPCPCEKFVPIPCCPAAPACPYSTTNCNPCCPATPMCPCPTTNCTPCCD